MAYSGGTIRLKELLVDPKENLVDQSLSSKSRDTPTNGDGFGVGWYSKWERPGLFQSIRPAWNDNNLKELAANIESHLFLAHVRASSLATVQETNCHPFRYGDWLFVHNGEIEEIEKFRRRLIAEVADEYFDNIQGTTDSELMFHIALTQGLRDDPGGAVSRTVGLIERIAREHGVDQSVWMTLGISDGKTIYAFRYASDGKAPTLYYSPEVHHVYRLNPGLEGRLGDHARAIVSEPVGSTPKMWKEVPQSTMLVTSGGDVEILPFAPASLA
jgi:glutamine amidotransferase